MIRKKKNEKTCRERRPKKKNNGQNGGNWNTQRNFSGKMTKILGKHIENVAICTFSERRYMFPQNFLDYTVGVL